MTSQTIIRGRLLSFFREPAGINDDTSYRYDEDGALLVAKGKIVASGDYRDVAGKAGHGAKEIDHRPHLILPGFIDTHLHFPQVQVIASWGAKLLDWLNTYTFPEEAKYSDSVHATAMAIRFFDELLRHGTTTASAYCSVHPQSVDAYFGEAESRGMRMIGGKVMMDRNAPPGVLDTAQSAYDDSKALISKWHAKSRLHYAITPRFAITSTPEQLEVAGALVQEHGDCHVQTHLSENHDEIAFTLELYPGTTDYLGVYERYGLLGEKSLFGHCIHLSDRERGALAETGSVAVFCPTSNLFLGSGLYDEAGLAAKGVRRAIATDVGGGTNYSMLRTLDEGYKILQLQNQKFDPFKAFYWITLGNAAALGMEGLIGTLEAGSDADFVVLDARATPAMALRHETVTTLAEELFLLQTLGDDRAIAETYVAGKASKPKTGG
jgi:guanine deaminase